MKKIKRYIICLIMCLMMGINIVNAKELEVISVKQTNENDVSSVEIKDNDDKFFDVLFKDVDAEVKYEVEIKNESDKEIQIDEISITESRNNAFVYSYEGIDKNTVIKGNDTKTFYLNIKYTNTESIEKIYDEDVSLRISYSNVEEVVNPSTGIKTLGYIGIVASALIVAYLFIRHKLTMFKQFGIFVLIISSISLIGISLASRSGELEIDGIVRHRGYYDVTVDPNGGYYQDSSEIQKFQVLAGEKYKLEEVKRDTYDFVSWEIIPNNVEIEDNEIEVKENLLIKALWDEVYYTLIIDPNTGVYNGISEEIKTSERPNSTVNLSVPEKTGYTFSHWTIEEEIYNKNSIEMTKDIKLVANYTKNTYKVEIDPNGGLFNNSPEKYIGTHEHGDKIRIDDIKRDNYDFLGYSDGEKLINAEEIEITSDIKLKAMWETIIKHTVRVDPNGGVYDNTSDVSSYEVREGTKFELTDAEYEGYVFDHWEKEDGSILNSNEFIVEEDVVIIAKWEEIVCRIEDTYYSSIMKAHEKAVAKDTIVLLKNTEEIVENKKDVTLDLGGFTVTGSLTNTETGKITIINGTIENPNGTAVINNGTFTMGVNDYKEDGSANIINDYVKIIGSTIGIEQNKIFNFYDGFIEGDIGLSGGYNDSPSYRNTFDNTVIKYFPFVDRNVEKNCQHIELEASDRAVSKTITNGEIYYYNLQDNINTSLRTGYKIYAVRDFDAAYPLSVPESGNITFDIDGMNVLIGDDITNDGTFKVTDGQNKTGSLKTSKTITNNGSLSIKDIAISKTQNGNLIENYGDLTLTNAKLTALTGASVKTYEGSTLTMDEESSLHSNDYALYINQGANLNLTKGTIYGINNFGTLTIDGLKVYNNGNNNAILHNQNATLTMNSGTITSTGNTWAINGNGSFIATGGKIESEGSGIKAGNVTISDIEIDARVVALLSSRGLVNISGGVYKVEESTYNGEFKVIYLDFTAEDSKITGGIFEGGHTALYIYSGSPTISGGTFTGNQVGAHLRNTSAIITGGLFIGNQYGAHLDESHATISGGTFTGGNSGIYAFRYSSPTISGGSFIGEIYGFTTNSGTSIITGGTFKGNTYGVYLSGPYASTLTLGEIGGKLDNTTPEIIGGTYGLYNNNNIATINFYDGILKGVTGGYSGTISLIEDGTEIVTNTETIDGEYYVTNYLVAKEPFLRVGSEEFNSFKKAEGAINESGTIYLIATTSYNSDAIIPSGKNIIFDLNGNKLTMTQSLTNNGTLTIKDNVGGGELINNRNETITNNRNANLIIVSGTISNIADNSANTIVSSSVEVSVTAIGGKIISKNGIGIVTFGVANSLTLSGDIEVTAKGDAVYLPSGTINITGGTFTSQNGSGVVANANDVSTISDGNFNGVNGLAISGTGKVTGGIYNGTESGLKITGGTPTITGGTFTGNKNGANIAGEPIISGGTFTGGEYGANIDKAYPKIKGGFFKGNTYGIYTNGGTITLGEKGGNLDTTTPEIVGGTYGLYNNNNSTKINYYDGILKGTELGYHSTFEVLEDGTKIKTDSEIIDNKEYVTNYLVAKENFLRVGSKEFNSFAEAVDAINDTGTIYLIATTSYDSDAIIPSGKDITFDLNGNKLTMAQSLTNNGTLTIKDSVGEGELINATNNTITNNQNASLTIESGTISNSSTVYNSSAINSSGALTVTGGKVESTKGYGIYRDLGSGIITISGGEIIASSTAFKISFGIVNISGGTFISTSTSAIETVVKGGPVVTITGGTFNGTEGATFYSGTIEITDGIFEGTRNGIVGGAPKTISGGTFIGEQSGASISGTSTITGGTFTGDIYGIHVTSGTLTLGTNDEDLNKNPEVTGGTYGLYNTATVYYYDGILKGTTSGFYGIIEDVATNSNIVYDQEIKDEVTYYTNYLEKQRDFIRNERLNKSYYIISEAINEGNNGDTLTFIRDTNVYDEVNIPADKNITINLAGHNVVINRSIINNGTLNLSNSDKNDAYIKSSTNRETIENTGTITISDIKILNEFNKYALVNKGIMTLNNVTTDVKKGIDNYNEDAELAINNSNITTTNAGINNVGKLDIDSSVIESGGYATAIYDTGTHENTIKNSTVHASRISSYALYMQKGSTYEITNNNITGTMHVLNTNGVLNITGGNISGNIDVGINNNGELNITGSNISAVIINTKNATIDNVTIETDFGASRYNNKLINNTGNIEIINSTIDAQNSNGLYTVYNSGSMIIDENTSINSNQYGIYNENDLEFKGTIEVEGNNTLYGIYNESGNLNIPSTNEVNISVSGQNAYGIYIDQGTVILGTPEDVDSPNYGKETADVSITNPLIKGIGTSLGYGVKNAQGRLDYYDGKLVGSTRAKPEVATNVEYLYEATTHTDEDGYEYEILEWMRRTTFTTDAELDIS